MNTPSDLDRDAALMQAARAELEQAAAELDALSVARLRAARMRALEIPARSSYSPLWLPAAAVALVMLITTITLRMQPQIAEQESLEMMTMLDDDYELYENLEFYEWLETETDEHSV